MGLLSRAFCGVPPCLNFENMAVEGIGETRLRTAATRYRVGALGQAYEQLNVARTLRSCVSWADEGLCSLWLVSNVRLADVVDTVPTQSHISLLPDLLWLVCGSHRDSKNATLYLKNIWQHCFIHKWISEQDHNCADMLQVAIHTVSCISRYDNLQILFKMWTISFDISEKPRDTRILRVV